MICQKTKAVSRVHATHPIYSYMHLEHRGITGVTNKIPPTSHCSESHDSNNSNVCATGGGASILRRVKCLMRTPQQIHLLVSCPQPLHMYQSSHPANHLLPCARLWLSTKSKQTAYWPLRIGPRYFHTSIFISPWDQEGPITLNPIFRIQTNSGPTDQKFVSKNLQKNVTKNNSGAVPPPYGAAPFPLTQVGSKCLATVVLDNHNRAHSPTLYLNVCHWDLGSSKI